MLPNRKFEITDARRGAALTVRVVTRAEVAEVVGVQEDGALKVRLMAESAGDDAANQELINLLSAQLGVPQKYIEIVAGVHGRDKIISVLGISVADVEALFGGRGAE